MGPFTFPTRWLDFFNRSPGQAAEQLEARDIALENWTKQASTAIGIASAIPGPTGPPGPTGATGLTGPAGTNGTNGVGDEVLLWMGIYS